MLQCSVQHALIQAMSRGIGKASSSSPWTWHSMSSYSPVSSFTSWMLAARCCTVNPSPHLPPAWRCCRCTHTDTHLHNTHTTHTRARAHSRMHTRTQTRTHARTHAHAHTHTLTVAVGQGRQHGAAAGVAGPNGVDHLPAIDHYSNLTSTFKRAAPLYYRGGVPPP